ncbi:MAG: hypothetical protein U0Q03_05195 [Acidimicrobiales bacterium]
MIEFLPPRHDAFGESDTADFVGVDADDAAGFDDDRPPTPRWLAVVAGVAVVGLLAGGVIAASPWSGDDAAPPTPAPTTVPSTAPTTVPSTVPDTLPDDGVLVAGGNPGWLLADDESGFELWSAASTGNSLGDGDPFVLWLSEGATRTSGRWLAIDVAAMGPVPVRREGALVDVGLADGTTRTALVSSTDDGVTEVYVGAATELTTPFAFTSFGLPLDQVLAVVATTDVSDGAITVPVELSAPGGALDGMIEVFHGTTDWYPESIGAGTPLAWSLFADDTLQWVQVGVSAMQMPAMLIDEYLLERPIDPRSLHRREQARLAELRRAGRSITLFTASSDDGIVGAWWYDGQGRRVTAAGIVPVETLIDVIADLQPADTAAWDEAVRTERTGPGAPEPVTIGGAATGDWSAQVGASWFWVSSTNEFVNHSWRPAPGRSVQTFTSFESRWVLVTDADGVATSAVVRHGGVDEPVSLVALPDGSTAGVVRAAPTDAVEVIWPDA